MSLQKKSLPNKNKIIVRKDAQRLIKLSDSFMAFGLGSKTKKTASKKAGGSTKKTEAQLEAEALLKAAQEKGDAGECPFC